MRGRGGRAKGGNNHSRIPDLEQMVYKVYKWSEAWECGKGATEPGRVERTGVDAASSNMECCTISYFLILGFGASVH